VDRGNLAQDVRPVLALPLRVEKAGLTLSPDRTTLLPVDNAESGMDIGKHCRTGPDSSQRYAF
jgi:hypothetical protein